MGFDDLKMLAVVASEAVTAAVPASCTLGVAGVGREAVDGAVPKLNPGKVGCFADANALGSSFLATPNVPKLVADGVDAF